MPGSGISGLKTNAIGRRAGSDAAARELWALVRRRGNPALLGAAVRARLVDRGMAAAEAVRRAESVQIAAHRCRAAAARRAAAPAAVPVGPTAPTVQVPDPPLLDAALLAVKRLLEALRAGSRPTPFDAGSLARVAEELLAFVGGTRPGPTGRPG